MGWGLHEEMCGKGRGLGSTRRDVGGVVGWGLHEEMWDHAEAESFKTGFPFYDRHGVEQNLTKNKSNVELVLEMVPQLPPAAPR